MLDWPTSWLLGLVSQRVFVCVCVFAAVAAAVVSLSLFIHSFLLFPHSPFPFLLPRPHLNNVWPKFKFCARAFGRQERVSYSNKSPAEKSTIVAFSFTFYNFYFQFCSAFSALFLPLLLPFKMPFFCVWKAVKIICFGCSNCFLWTRISCGQTLTVILSYHRSGILTANKNRDRLLWIWHFCQCIITISKSSTNIFSFTGISQSV